MKIHENPLEIPADLLQGARRFHLQQPRGCLENLAQLLRGQQRAQRGAALLQLGRGDGSNRAGGQDA